MQRICATTCGGSQFERKRAVNVDLLRIRYEINAKRSDRKDCDITRLIATGEVRNKFSF